MRFIILSKAKNLTLYKNHHLPINQEKHYFESS